MISKAKQATSLSSPCSKHFTSLKMACKRFAFFRWNSLLTVLTFLLKFILAYIKAFPVVDTFFPEEKP